MTTIDSAYETARRSWQTDPKGWWRSATAAVEWTSEPRELFDETSGPYGRWFPDGRLNMSVNCLDRHVRNGNGDRPALIWESPVTGSSSTLSYAELLEKTARLAGALLARGVSQGDRVLIYMPMIPEAVVAMLACTRIGAVHSVVFGGFAANELAARILDAQPAAVITASCGVEPNRTIAYLPLVRSAFGIASVPRPPFIVVNRPALLAELEEGETDFGQAIAAARPADPVDVAATDPLYILYTSGTTGRPKGIVRDTGGYTVALLRSMEMVYGLRQGDVTWTASDIGWVVGHSYIVYGPLLMGCTTVMYEGKPVGTPDASAFWRLCARHQVKVLFTAPTAIRAIRQADPDGRGIAHNDLSSLEAVFLAGERCDPSTASWLKERLSRPVIDHWWQTETGWPITAGFREYDLVDLPEGSGGRAAPGWQVDVVDEEGALVPPGTTGALVIRLPLPPGAAPTLWQDDAGFHAAYLAEFPGYYSTGDAGSVSAAGEVFVMGRTDDVINVAGHRLSTGAMEEIVSSHPAVAECAVFGLSDELKGQIPFGLFVVAGDAGETNDLGEQLIAMVRNRIGAIATPRAMVAVSRLPKTRSGKILRRVLRQMGDRKPVQVPPTIEDESALDDARAVISAALGHSTDPHSPQGSTL